MCIILRGTPFPPPQLYFTTEAASFPVLRSLQFVQTENRKHYSSRNFSVTMLWQPCTYGLEKLRHTYHLVRVRKSSLIHSFRCQRDGWNLTWMRLNSQVETGSKRWSWLVSLSSAVVSPWCLTDTVPSSSWQDSQLINMSSELHMTHTVKNVHMTLNKHAVSQCTAAAFYLGDWPESKTLVINQ